MIFYIDWIIPNRFAAITVLFIIFVRPKYRGDVGLIEHERTHVKQFWRYFIFHSLFYALNSRYRYKSELEAYRVQLSHSTDPVKSAKLFACFLSKKYRLNITHERAYNDLMER